MAHMNDIAFTSSIPDVCIDERRLPLFIARATLRELIAGLKARATGDAARWCYLCTRTRRLGECQDGRDSGHRLLGSGHF